MRMKSARSWLLPLAVSAALIGCTQKSPQELLQSAEQFIAQQNNVNCAVLELSSFQLEYATTFAPDIAYITNFSPNHLDRHKTIEQYWRAKTHVFTKQKLK